MKKKTTPIIALLTCGLMLLGGEVFTNSGGVSTPKSGSPKSNNKTCTECHSGGSITAQSVAITSNIPASGYLPNTDYTIKVKLMGNGGIAAKGGINATVEDAAGFAGALSAIPQTGTAVSGNSATHTSSNNTFSNDSLVYQFNWNSGNAANATVYVAANFANGNGATSGDAVATNTLALTKNNIGIDELAISDIKVYPNPVKDIAHVSFYTPKGGYMSYSVIDANGSVISQNNKSIVQAGELSLSFDMSNYPAGVYFLNVELNNRNANAKLIKVD